MPAPSRGTDAILYDYLYKPLSAQLCWLHPNWVTIACFLLIGPVIYGLHYGWALSTLVALMFVRQSLDCMDGAIARECKTTSKLGALLDIMEDTLTVILLGGYMTWRLRSRPIIAIPFAAVVLYSLTIYVRQIQDHMADRKIQYSAFEQFVHDNTVVISMVLIATFRWILN
jgi:phosphatidylglycerophosphate synthase